VLSKRKTKGEGKANCSLRGKLEEKERVTAVYKETTGEVQTDCCLQGKIEEKERVTAV
jgi:hypothetical protein